MIRNDCMGITSDKLARLRTRRRGHGYKRKISRAAQNNDTRTNYGKVKIDTMQHNKKCNLYSERDETVNHIVSKYSKLAQKMYKTRHEWVEKVIH